MDQLLRLKRKHHGWTIAQAIGEELKANEVIAASFKSWMASSGRSYQEIEEKCGVPVKMLLAWELGTVSPMACLYYEVILFLGPNYYKLASMLLAELLLNAGNLRIQLQFQNQQTTRYNFDALGAVNRLAA